MNWEVPWNFIEDFYNEPGMISAFAQNVRTTREKVPSDFVLFSFHGLPELHVMLFDPGCLATPECCDRMTAQNARCYRAQSYATARAIAKELGLKASEYSVSFQSRLGRSKWIEPFTDVVFGELIQRGVKRLTVVCPAFVADCLETLEEIAIRGRESFRELGGEELTLVPSLNSSPLWAQTVAALVSQASAASQEL
jgi:ferrochelatase